ncbi:MAG: bifunctional phosphopantothenoylcysteine decarboxylase/phosphopantothenate--cysteine ligase CoaBC [Deltaproteobacteria bacterium]|nr:bifunctional phosphopantothenoylcysteine decarboxylase/phosphopantothenate--cysteine ligase CoaBC [Deltaproteobacteria bacterium]
MRFSTLSSKKILLGVTGSIAAYKSVELVRELSRQGAAVTVVMTESAGKFVGLTTFNALSGHPVYTDLFNNPAEPALHINLPRQADAIVIAPATANFIGKMAHGIADDLLSTIVLAAQKPILVCPAMNSAMYEHPAMKGNLDQLRKYGYQVVEPETGPLACGDEGPGRLAEPSTICEAVKIVLEKKDLQGRKIVVTAGPTEEPIDPVRFISNRSSGKMGYSLARVARRRGAEVVLISGPTCLSKPWDIEFVPVRTAAEMYKAVLSYFDWATIVIKAAAVADYGLSTVLPQKLKKGTPDLSLNLTRTPDILKELGKRKKRQFLVGFAAESKNLIAGARRKLQEKNLDLIVANDITVPGAGFGFDTNQVKIITADGEVIDSPLLDKEEIAYIILDKVLEVLQRRRGKS